MRKFSVLFITLLALIGFKASADVTILVHAPSGAPYIYAYNGSAKPFGEFPGIEMTNSVFVNDVQYYYATVPGVNSTNFILSNGTDTAINASSGNQTAIQASGAVPAVYYFWNQDEPAQINSFYPTKIYVGEPLVHDANTDTWTDPNAETDVYVWFHDDSTSVCGSDDYPAWGERKVSQLPVENVLGTRRHYFVYKHHTDENPVLVFSDGQGSSFETSTGAKTDKIDVQDSFVYTYNCNVSDGVITEITGNDGVEVFLPIDEYNFPDANFRTFVKSTLDINDSNSLTMRELNSVLSLEVGNQGISDLSGIEYFRNLKALKASKNPLTETIMVDGEPQVVHSINGLLAKFPMLLELDVSDCGLTESFDLKLVPQLQILRCGHIKDYNLNQLNTFPSLDVTMLPNLVELKCEVGSFATLDLTHNPHLKLLNCNNGSLTSLDLSQNKELTQVSCGNNDDWVAGGRLNRIESIDVSNCPNLTVLYAPNLGLRTFDFTGSNNLETLFFQKNPDLNIGSLDLKDYPAIKVLYCGNTGVTDIDVSNCPLLYSFFVDNNKLTKLDVSKNPELQYLYCESNQLDELDVDNNPKLISLSFSDNNISEINTSHLTQLTYFFCVNNHLLWADVPDAAPMTTLAGNGQTRTMPAIANVLNAENEDEIIYQYLVEMPTGFVESNVVSILTKDVNTMTKNGKVYFVLPKDKLLNNKFVYNYSPKSSNPSKVLQVTVTTDYPAPKFGFSGIYKSTFDPETGKNTYWNTVTLSARDLLDTDEISDVDVTYTLKRFKMMDAVYDSDGNVIEEREHEHFDGNVAEMTYRKHVDGDDVSYKWEVKVNGEETGTEYDLDQTVTFTDEISENVGDIKWFCYRYNVVRDINGDIFEAPVYTGHTTAGYAECFTLDEIKGDTYDVATHKATLSQPGNIAVAINHNAAIEDDLTQRVTWHSELNTTCVTEKYFLETSKSSLAPAEVDEDGNIFTGDSDYNRVYGVITATVEEKQGDNPETWTNTYGTLPVSTHTYDLAASFGSKRAEWMGSRYDGRYFYYTISEVKLDVDDDSDVECAGFNVWRLGAEEPVAEFDDPDELANYCEGHNIFTNAGDESFVANNYLKQENIETSFGSKKRLPTDNILVRAYYRIVPPAVNKARSRVTAKGDAAPQDKYIVAEKKFEVPFSFDEIYTAVNGVIAEEVVSVRYLDLAGRSSDKPFAGATLKVVTYANGSVAKQLIK